MESNGDSHSESDEDSGLLDDIGEPTEWPIRSTESERRVGEVLSQAVGPRPGFVEAMSAPTRRIYEQNSGQRSFDAEHPSLNGPHSSRPWADRVATPSS